MAAVGGDGEWVVPDPIDPNWLWGDSENGVLTVYNKVTKDTIIAMPYIQNSLESYDLSKSKFRFNWDSPIAFAPWNGHIAWLGANVLFQTTDRGRHWTVISPDLTLNDKAHQQPTGGPLVHDVSGAEYSDNLLYIEGSTLKRSKRFGWHRRRPGPDDAQRRQEPAQRDAAWRAALRPREVPNGRAPGRQTTERSS